jgi:hypothetical protein
VFVQIIIIWGYVHIRISRRKKIYVRTTQPCFMSRHSIQPYFFDITWNIEIFLLIVNINLINTENVFCLMCYFFFFLHWVLCVILFNLFCPYLIINQSTTSEIELNYMINKYKNNSVQKIYTDKKIKIVSLNVLTEI